MLLGMLVAKLFCCPKRSPTRRCSPLSTCMMYSRTDIGSLAMYDPAVMICFNPCSACLVQIFGFLGTRNSELKTAETGKGWGVNGLHSRLSTFDHTLQALAFDLSTPKLKSKTLPWMLDAQFNLLSAQNDARDMKRSQAPVIPPCKLLKCDQQSSFQKAVPETQLLPGWPQRGQAEPPATAACVHLHG